jgi:hypothetical protein
MSNYTNNKFVDEHGSAQHNNVDLPLNTKTKGNIYIIHSITCNVLKIGKTIRDVKDTNNRYATTYGSMHIYMFPSNNIDYDEKKIHYLLREYNECLEIFSVECLNEALMICKNICDSDYTKHNHIRKKRIIKDPDMCKITYTGPSKHAVYIDMIKDVSADDKKILLYFNNKIKLNKVLCSDNSIATVILNGILNADPISDVEYINIINQRYIINKDDIFSVLKYKLRKLYDYDDIDEEFIKIYCDKRTIKIYKNLSDYIDNKNNYINVEHDIRKISLDFIHLCGYNDIFDQSIIAKNTLVERLNNNKNLIETKYPMIQKSISDVTAPKEWKFSRIMVYINTILYATYGIKIIQKSRSRNDRCKIIIKHYYNGILFDM